MNTYLLYPGSSLPDSKEQYPAFPLKNGGMAGAIELKQPVGVHCHGSKALAREDSVDNLMARRKLYIASAVCLVFMIGEVIGKRLEEPQERKRAEGHTFVFLSSGAEMSLGHLKLWPTFSAGQTCPFQLMIERFLVAERERESFEIFRR